MTERSTACLDWADRLRDGRSIIPPPIFPDEAEAGLSVMRELRIVDAPGSPRMGDACGQWVFDLAASVFGAYDADSGRRLITEWFVMLPKKNFKSGLAASIMLTSLIRNWRQSAEFTILAPTVEVANNSFGPARDMVTFREPDENLSELENLIHVQGHIKTLTHRNKNATLRVIAADANTAAGKKSVGTLIEELWLFGKQPGAAEMLREALGGLASRPEGFTIWLTTQSDEPPAGVFKEKLQYARDVRDGKIHDPQFVPIIYEHPPEVVEAKQHLKVESLAMVNPNLGYSVDQTFLHREFRKATEEGESSLRGFLAKHGNVEIGLNLRHDRWAGSDFWEAAGDATLTLDELMRRSEVVVFGIDGGGLDDLLGLSAIGREKDTRRWLHWAHAWAHEIVLQRRKEIAPRLLDFQKAGQLTIVQRPGQDVVQVADIICKVRDAQLLPDKNAIGVDAAGIGAIVEELTTPARNLTPDHIVAISQGWKLNGAIKTVERMVAGGEMVHGATELMAWSVSNARVVPVGNAVTINKQVSGSAKIDPLMATFDAASLMALNPAPAVAEYQIFFL
ncbi:terminase large subunit [Pseudorhodoferax sp. Leaf267]|uniref:terminase large subunit n=1 Tax=Pseudorhodoferax sp. Leaf267 TaxID=1736316 RepID=UPI0006F6CA9C|nr:terminase large subunit [Pseudorhodoferax sp. Leaf267]KQP20562.1 terminase [Pseudorhodoferax sp. Leaf267]